MRRTGIEASDLLPKLMQWKGEAERASLPKIRGDPNASVMGIYDPFGDKKAESEATTVVQF
jgi:hypothetical protein